MAPQKRRPAASAKANGSIGEQLPGRLELGDSGVRRGPQAITTPREAVADMLAAGATFTVQRREDVLCMSFTYSVGPGGDLDRCHAILAAIKAKPPAFLAGFKALIADAQNDR